jgi:mutator protein MutT
MREILAAAAVIEKKGLFLITKRLETSHLGHCWEFPGGKIEKGESINECVIRECMEEIGVVIEPIQYLREQKYSYPGKDVLLHFVLCRLVRGEPQTIECADLTWIYPSQFSEYEFPPADQEVIEELLR